ncbi:MAG TPA: dihydrofolate reductase family protein [Propionibacteriaceae bacterium]|nr:dihydrofolate reductase family protein [Propionibacteriaceae bacterium]
MATQYYTATSIDGYIADADNSLEWLFSMNDAPGMDQEYPRFMAEVGALAMGSTTYEWILDHTALRDDPSQWEYDMPCWVFSSRDLPKLEGADIRFVSGDVAPVHAEMVAAAQGRNIWLVGGGDLVGQFHDAGLLDEIILGVASVTLGAGAPLLPRRIVTPPLRLLSAKQFGGSFVSLHYAVTTATATGLS